MTTTHGHRKYTMSEAARNQRRIARQARAKNPRRQQAGRTIGLHITPQAAAIVLSYPQGRKRRDFVSTAILQYPLPVTTTRKNTPLDNSTKTMV